MSSTQDIGNSQNRILRLIVITAFCFIAAGAAAYYVYSTKCPCEGIPGGILFGERIEEPVEDWSMVNDVEICQLQIAAGFRPHSINLNCWATPDGDLFVGCMSCESKYWGYQVGPNEQGYIRVAGRLYPVTLNRIENTDEMDKIWRSRFFKLGLRSPEPVPETPRADGWWAFSVVSRAT